MKDSIVIKGNLATAKFFDKMLSDKRARKEETRRKFKNGELPFKK